MRTPTAQPIRFRPVSASDQESIDWVARLRDNGITVEEVAGVEEWATASGKLIGACILASPRPGGHVFSVALHPGLPPAIASEVCYEAMVRFDRLANHGYEPDGWQHRSDGDYQLWLRYHDFGPDFPLQ